MRYCIYKVYTKRPEKSRDLHLNCLFERVLGEKGLLSEETLLKYE